MARSPSLWLHHLHLRLAALSGLGLVLLVAPLRTAAGTAPVDVDSLPVVCTADRVALDWSPEVTGHDHALGHGLEIALRALGQDTDYDLLMGDLGLAFIAQASDQVPRYDGALDVGWWPLDPAGLSAYAPFAGQAAGRQIRLVLPAAGDAALSDTARWQAFEPQVRAALQSGRPVLGCHDWWKVITGLDRGTRQFTVFCPARGRLEVEELPAPSFFAYLFIGDRVPALDRQEADRLALEHAVALGHDAVAMPGGYVTGQKAFALWAQTLRDMEHRGQARWHANMVGHLMMGRRSAVAYLRGMAARHAGTFATHLDAAAGHYEETLRLLDAADLTPEALEQSTAGREELAVRVERVATAEARAVGEMEAAFRR